MIVVDHALAGAAICVLLPEASAAAWAAALVGSLYPDFDILFGRPGTLGYLRFHRTYSHSVVLAPIAALLIALGLHLLSDEVGLAQLFSIVFVCIVLHLALDVLNGFGTRLFLPLYRPRQSLDILFEFDPAITLILGLTVLGAWLTKSVSGDGTAGFAIGGLCLVLYVAWRAHSRWVFSRDTRAITRSIDEEILQITIVPASYWRWKGIFVTAAANWVARTLDKKLEVTRKPIRKIPPEFDCEAARIYSSYARHLDVAIGDRTVSMRNLIYSPETYRLDLRQGTKGAVDYSISLPRPAPDDY